MDNIELTKDQLEAKSLILDWYSDKRSKDTFVISGYAGTGKTFLLGEMRQDLYLMKAHKIAYACYTGKASVVLKKKLRLFYSSDFCYDFCGTIHGLIYEAIIDPKTQDIIGWRRKEDVNYDLIVIDEGSMIDKQIYDDLLSYGIKLLIFGDHFQLPPVSEDAFNIMEKPDFIITEIVRQESDNPIIQLSMKLRQYQDIPYGQYGESIAKVNSRLHGDIIKDFIRQTVNFKNTLFLCGFNRTRCSWNKDLKKIFGFGEGLEPIVGERVICLRNNWNATPLSIANGMLGTILSIEDLDDNYEMEVEFDDELYHYYGNIAKEPFGNPKPDLKQANSFVSKKDFDTGKETVVKTSLDFFDFGYCLTVHKAQGSQATRVMLIEEPCKFWEGEMWYRWLYTAITRAEKQLLIIR